MPYFESVFDPFVEPPVVARGFGGPHLGDSMNGRVWGIEVKGLLQQLERGKVEILKGTGQLRGCLPWGTPAHLHVSWVSRSLESRSRKTLYRCGAR